MSRSMPKTALFILAIQVLVAAGSPVRGLFGRQTVTPSDTNTPTTIDSITTPSLTPTLTPSLTPTLTPSTTSPEPISTTQDSTTVFSITTDSAGPPITTGGANDTTTSIFTPTSTMTGNETITVVGNQTFSMIGSMTITDNSTGTLTSTAALTTASSNATATATSTYTPKFVNVTATYTPSFAPPPPAPTQSSAAVVVKNITVSANDSSVQTSGPDWSTGKSPCDASQNTRQTNATGQNLKFSFIGTAVFLNTVQSSQSGAFAVAVDDQAPVKVDDFVPNDDSGTCGISWSSYGLQEGPHVVTITTQGQSSDAATDGNTATQFQMNGFTVTSALETNGGVGLVKRSMGGSLILSTLIGVTLLFVS